MSEGDNASDDSKSIDGGNYSSLIGLFHLLNLILLYRFYTLKIFNMNFDQGSIASSVVISVSLYSWI